MIASPTPALALSGPLNAQRVSAQFLSNQQTEEGG